MITMRPKSFLKAFILFTCLIYVFCSSPENKTTMEFDIGHGIKACFDKPVVVSMSKVGEKRWGYHQFASISPYPGDRILLHYHVGADAVKAYGTASPTFITADNGKSWEPFNAEGLPTSGLSCPVFNEQFLCLPATKPLNLKDANLTLPEPVCKSYSYEWHSFFRLSECPPAIQNFFMNMDATRWTQESKQWEHEIIRYDSTNALIWTITEGEQSNLVARTVFERPPLKLGNDLLYADYRTNYILDDGSVPPKFGVTCMVSHDNGDSWQRRSTIAVDKKGKDNLTEPMIEENVNGELVCVIRRTDHEQKSMMITFSADSGKTWKEPVALDQLGEFGVMPCLTRLDCGVMVLSYGRPGIWLSFSLDGTGHEWTDPVCMLEDDMERRHEVTDAYTTMLPLGPNQLLMAYTYFEHKDAKGNQRKAVMVRKLTIKGVD